MRALLVLALLAGCVQPPPASGDLNAQVLAVVAGYPADGSYGYWWPNGSAWEGTTQDVVYGGRRLCTGDPQHRSYCCGLMFEVYMKACERAPAHPLRARRLSADDAHELRLRFFGDSKVAGERRRLVQHALVSMGLGRAIDRLEDARAGDFVQFWRKSGSGHQAVFIDWERAGPEIVAIRYWSTQSSTRGIGCRAEPLAGLNREEIYIVRATP